MECAAQGEEFLKEAEKKTKKKMFKKPKWREALSLYNKAAAQCKRARFHNHHSPSWVVTVCPIFHPTYSISPAVQLASMYDRVAETYLTMAEMVETQ